LLSGEEWLQGLNRLVARPDLPLTLQGGEPTLHPDFFAIINGIHSELPIDILTNLEVDVDRFMEEIRPERVKREAPYASIRVSYHPESMAIEPLAGKVLKLLVAGYSVGIWGVLHPYWESEIFKAQAYCAELGIDFRTKEFLGDHGGVMHGLFSYPEACARGAIKKVSCRTTELIVGPDGNIYRCHSDLYAGRASVGNILDPELTISKDFRSCDCYGFCNPCDVKLKTNRFQTFGHTSVEIVFDTERC
jgi:MoaA/NifB/PqqE/SkfB family radical SAM enzyme